ncbi:MAG: hypothetical protein MUE36_05755 [Acidimicrobiales bacterium]|nr:hypothetical protein [Acidimicrobiales bacterium]
MRAHRLLLPLVVLLAVVSMGAACSSDVQSFDGSAPSSTREEPDAPSEELGAPGEALDASQIRCLDDELVEVPCDDLHVYEEFELPGTDLNDCVTTIEASSDLTIVPDPDEPGDLEIDDPRVNGHAYTSIGEGVSCQITLAEPRTGTFLA